jgi:hypothetical protein
VELAEESILAGVFGDDEEAQLKKYCGQITDHLKVKLPSAEGLCTELTKAGQEFIDCGRGKNFY